MQNQTILSKEIQNGGVIRPFFFCQIEPLSRDRARILYLIILWADYMRRVDPVNRVGPLRIYISFVFLTF